MMTELVAFLEARLNEDQEWAEGCQGHRWRWERTDNDTVAEPDPVVEEYLADGDAVALRSVEEYESPYGLLSMSVPISHVGEVTSAAAGHIVRHDPARVLADVAADRKLIARYKAAVESHEEALKALQDARKDAGDEDVFHAAEADLAAAHASGSAYLAVLEDRAGRFSDHEDYQEQWGRP